MKSTTLDFKSSKCVQIYYRIEIFCNLETLILKYCNSIEIEWSSNSVITFSSSIMGRILGRISRRSPIDTVEISPWLAKITSARVVLAMQMRQRLLICMTLSHFRCCHPLLPGTRGRPPLPTPYAETNL